MWAIKLLNCCPLLSNGIRIIKTCLFELSCLVYEPACLYVIVVQAALPESGNFNALLSVFSVRQLSPRFFGQASKKQFMVFLKRS